MLPHQQFTGCLTDTTGKDKNKQNFFKPYSRGESSTAYVLPWILIILLKIIANIYKIYVEIS